MRKDDCIFCKIVAGEAPSYTVWQDDHHMAFLTPRPNTEGFTVLVTKDHYDSYFAELPDDIRSGLMAAATKVAKLLDSKFDDVGRTGVILEGFGVNHIHAKLVPLHGTKDDTWKQHASTVKTYHPIYEGYITSNDSLEQDSETLAATAKKITG